jgi:hypothetical protein
MPNGTGKLIGGDRALGKVFVYTVSEVFEVSAGLDIKKLNLALPQGMLRKIEGFDKYLVLLGDKGVGLWNGNKFDWTPMEQAPTAACVDQEMLILGGKDKIEAYPVIGPLDAGHQIYQTITKVGGTVGIVTHRTLPVKLDIVVVGQAGLQGFTIKDGKPVAVDVPLFYRDRVPLTDPVSVVRVSNGGFMVAAKGGVYRVVDGGSLIGPEYRVYVPDRWMPSAWVNAAVEVGDSNLSEFWFATDKGPGWVTRKNWTLKEKMDKMVERVILRHNRDGAVADSHLTTP